MASSGNRIFFAIESNYHFLRRAISRAQIFSSTASLFIVLQCLKHHDSRCPKIGSMAVVFLIFACVASDIQLNRRNS